MKGKVIKIITILCATILISMVGFFGIYTQKQNRMENVVKGYDFAMNLNGARVISIKPTKDIETTIKDAEGNVIEEELTDEQIQEKGYKKEEVDKNVQYLTIDNFNKVKEIVSKRLERMKAEDYEIKLDEQTGEITVELEENANTDTIISNISKVGKFEMVDSETQEVLLDNSYIKETNVAYGGDETGTIVCLGLIFTDEGKAKLEEITNTYKKVEDTEDEETTDENTTDENTTDENTTDENTTEENATEENTTDEETEDEETKQKEVIMKLDGEEMITTSFDKPISNGKMQLTVGQSSTDANQINENAKNASGMATLIGDGEFPMEYEVSGNEYIFSEITNQQLQYLVYAVAGIIVIALIYLIIKYKLRGVIASCSFIGYTALLLLLIRYTNVMISLEGIAGIILALAISYLFLNKLLCCKDKKEHITFFLKIVPICISAITFCFIEWAPIASFGMVMFWGIILTVAYHYAVTKPLINIIENKE